LIERLRSESGWAVATAIVMLAVMISVGLAAMALVDNQNRQSGNQRQRESSLNLDEGAVFAQGFVLTQNWPNAQHQYPASCSSSGIASQWTDYCPNPVSLAAATSSDPALANFSTTDFLKNTTWVTKVRDNGPISTTDAGLSVFYDPTKADLSQSGTDAKGKSYTCPGPCTWDANGDHRMWVQASAVVRGHPRAVVAQLQLELLTEDVPTAAVRAGSLNVSNNGNHGGTFMLNGTGDGTANGGIWLRCDPTQGTSCASYQNGQVSPTPQQLPSAQQGPLMNNAELQRLKNTAVQNNTYYSGCPTKGGPNNVYGDNLYHLEGQVVWVDNCPVPPQMSNSIYTVPCSPLPSGMSSNCINSPTAPGVLVWHGGVMSLSGNVTFVGLLYAVNDSDGTAATGPITGDVITMDGGFGVYGAIAIDGNGRLNAGSNGLQLFYTNIAFDAIQTYGTAGLVQNTWRELPPNS
jgi:Tfp pilus assembly protein PilX